MIRLLSLAILFSTWTLAATAEKRIALIIGNSEYERSAWDLENPKNDVALVESALNEIGFEVFTLLDASRLEMEQAFKAHGDRLTEAGKSSTGFFYFAGHGMQSEGLNYLIPVDATAYTEADVWAQAPRLDNLFRHLRRAGNTRNFVVLDACRDNPLLSSVRNLSGGLASVTEARGTLIAYATAPGSVAEDGGSNSPYSTVLAELIVEPGQSVETLFRRVRTRVEAATNYRQRPWMESGLSGEADYCFAGCDAAPLLANDEVTALGQALQSNQPGALLEFLERFPGSKSRSLVEDRLKASALVTSADLGTPIDGNLTRSSEFSGSQSSEFDEIEVDYLGFVLTSSLQALSIPSVDGAPITELMLSERDTFQVIAVSNDKKWAKIKKNGHTGYVPTWSISMELK